MMNIDSDLANNTATIYQLLEELQTQLAALKEQIQLGLVPVQTESNPVEMVTPEESSLLDDDSSLTDGF